jgi:geranylgeranyl diphosphate synthase type I
MLISKETALLKLQEALDNYLPLIEDELRVCMTPHADSPLPFFGMLHYHLGWTDEQFHPTQVRAGKRLRPLLTLLTCQAAGGDPRDALPAAAAVELIHNFSLIHDDIQDHSAIRRGRSTVWALWGEAQAINAGDTMFTLAHLALHRLSKQGIPPDRIIAALHALDRTNLALCQGQHMDLHFEGRLDVDSDAYMTMIWGKTAALLGCSAQLGALVALSDPALPERYRRVGEELGLAFQIQDDILGIWGTADVTGKPVADDVRNRKKSLPIVYVLGRQYDADAKRLHALYAQETLSEEEVTEIVAILDASQARLYSQELARYYLEAALTELEAAKPEPEAGEALRELAHFLIKRAY